MAWHVSAVQAPMSTGMSEQAGHAAAPGTVGTCGATAQADARGAGRMQSAQQRRRAQAQRADALARSRAGARRLAAALGPARGAAGTLDAPQAGEPQSLASQPHGLVALRPLEGAMAERLRRAYLPGAQSCAGRPPRNRRSEAEYRVHLDHAYRRARARPLRAWHCSMHAYRGIESPMKPAASHVCLH